MTISVIATVALIMKEREQFAIISATITAFSLAATKQLMGSKTTANVLDCSCNKF